MLCVTVFVLRVTFFTARSLILFTIYIGRHFVYLVFVYILSPIEE